MCIATLASQSYELEQIASLSKENLRTYLSEEEKKSQGFITWEYNLTMLEKMNAIAPAVILKYNEEVVGYALTAFKETISVQPELGPMIEHLETLSFKNKSMADYRYYIMGQVCIAKEHRGKGLFDMLYQHHKKVFQPQFDIVATEVSTSNHRSLRAHQKTGFQTIATYRDELDEWDVVVWDWQ